MGGGALSSNYVSKLGSKEVSKKLRNFSFAIKKACHCEDERSEDVAIAKSLNINEITTSHFANAPRNDKLRHPELVSGSKTHPKLPLKREGKCAFTLAEVLITLGIIGVVAALTLPSVINNFREKATVAKVKKFYSIISQAHLQALEEKGTPDNWNIGGFLNEEGAKNLINAWAPYLKITKICGSTRGCYKNVVYKDLSGNPRYNIDNTKPFAKAILADGFLIDTQALSPAYWDGYNGKVYGAVHVDINGKSGPNTYGKDHFRFYVTDKAIVPSGVNTTLTYNFHNACLNNVTDMQGTACTAWVLYNENMDYLHCKDLSWTGKTKCKSK